jgi:dihydropteroate synthase type 2/dihydropteroate synthase type 3
MKLQKAKILGIVNITSDSFSDGGLYLETEKAIAHALQLHADGADIIDLGAASSNPNTSPISVEEEIARLDPVIDALQAKKIPVSVDSFKPDVQRYCISKNVDYINDIQGFPYPELYRELAESNCKLIMMHSIQRIGTATIIETEPKQVFSSIIEFFEERITAITKAGVERKRIIIDPGMGFFLGSNPESSTLVLEKFPKLIEKFGLPVLIAVSRKSFLSKLTNSDVKTSSAASIAAELYAYKKGAEYIRTHDVKSLREALSVWNALA